VGKLESFDHASWVKGLTLDFTAWGGVAIKLKKAKLAKKARVISPAVHVLTNERDNAGRSLERHRARVDYLSNLYDSGLDFYTKQPVDFEGRDDVSGMLKNRDNEPWRDTRSQATTNEGGLTLLMRVFKAQHDASDSDD
jgi:hypothetical protein